MELDIGSLTGGVIGASGAVIMAGLLAWVRALLIRKFRQIASDAAKQARDALRRELREALLPETSADALKPG